MTKLLINIDTYRTFCGNCYFQDIVNRHEWYCNCFRKFLTVNADGSFSRSEECLAAEKAVKELSQKAMTGEITEFTMNEWIQRAYEAECNYNKWKKEAIQLRHKITFLNRILREGKICGNCYNHSIENNNCWNPNSPYYTKLVLRQMGCPEWRRIDEEEKEDERI